jgi:hypothetical protein
VEESGLNVHFAEESHLAEAEKLEKKGKLDAAIREYQKAPARRRATST